MGQIIDVGGAGVSNAVTTVPTFAALPTPPPEGVGAERVTADAGVLYIWDGSAWNATAGGGAVVSVNGKTGTVSLDTNDIPEGATNKYATYANINSAIGAPPNSFIFSDATSQIVGYGDWQIDPTTHFSNVDNFYSPDDLGVNTNIHTWNSNVEPLQNSPDDSMSLHFFGINLDAASTGFSFGTSGQAAILLSGGYNYGGNGASFGLLRDINFFNGFGNGTDPGTLKGISASSHAYNISANITLDGSFTGYDFNIGINPAAITTSNFQILWMSDFSNMPVDVYGYQGLVCQPTIATIKNNHNFSAIGVGPNITTMEGNSGWNGVGLFPNITTSATGGVTALNFNPTVTTMVSNSSVGGVYVGGTITAMGAVNCSYQGMNVNPHITTSHGSIQCYQAGPSVAGGDANVDCYQANMGQVTTTGNVSVMNLSGLTANGRQSQMGADNVRMNIGGELVPLSAQTIQSQHVIFTSYNQAGVGAITGTTVLCNILSPDVNFGNIGDSIAVGPTGIANSFVAFAGQMHGHGQMDSICALLPTAIFADDFVLGEWRNVNAYLINGGYTGVCTNATAFYHEVAGAGLFATNHWGLRVVTTGVENYVESMAFSTVSQKVTNASVAIELGGVTRAFVNLNVTTTEKNALTALPGMQVFDTTLNQLSYYNGTVWVNV